MSTQRNPARLVGMSGRESRFARQFSGVTNIQQLGVGVEKPATAVDIDGHLTLGMQADPHITGQGPAENKAVIWVSDGSFPPFNKGDIVATTRVDVDGEPQYKSCTICEFETSSATVLITDEDGNYIVCAGIDADDADAYIIGDYVGD